MAEYTFHNVTITLEASSAKEAYTKLCEMFEREAGLGYETDTYTGHYPDEENGPTFTLFPEYTP